LESTVTGKRSAESGPTGGSPKVKEMCIKVVEGTRTLVRRIREEKRRPSHIDTGREDSREGIT
jgi:hypothetical protein